MGFWRGWRSFWWYIIGGIFLVYRQVYQKKGGGAVTTNTQVFVTNPQFHGTPHRYSTGPVTPPGSNTSLNRSRDHFNSNSSFGAGN